MHNNFYLCLSAFLLVMLAGCNNSNSDNLNVQGTWSGKSTMTASPYDSSVPQMDPVVAAFEGNNGYGFIFDLTDQSYFVMPPASDMSFSGNILMFIPPGVWPINLANNQTLLSDGVIINHIMTISFNTSGTSPPNNCNTLEDCIIGSFNLQSSTPFTNTPAIIPGDWQGYDLRGPIGTSVVWTVTTSGSFSGNDSVGNTWSGTLKQLQSGSNLFPVQATATQGGGPTYPYVGLGYESSTDMSGQFGHAMGTYFYVGVSIPQSTDPTGVHFIEFKIQ